MLKRSGWSNKVNEMGTRWQLPGQGILTINLDGVSSFQHLEFVL